MTSDNIYAPIKLEAYEVGGHKLVRVANLIPIKRGRMNSLEASIRPEDYPEADHDRQRLVVAFGNGVDSWAMLIELHERGIRPDCIQWADTGSERRHTYLAFNVMQAWCQRVGFPPIVIVRRRCPQAGHRSLAEQLWNTEQVPSPAYRQNHSCSMSWKLEPQRKFQRLLPWLWTATTTVKQAIGFSAGEVETRRGARVKEAIGIEASEYGKRKSTRYQVDNDEDYEQWYPLVDYNMTRTDCLDSIDGAGLPRPGKSACFFCPMSKLCELRAMSEEEPESISFALAIEQRFQASKNFKRDEAKPVRGLAGHGATWAERLAGDERAAEVEGLRAGVLPESEFVEYEAVTVPESNTQPRQQMLFAAI